MAGNLGIQESGLLDYKSNQFCNRFKPSTFRFSMFLLLDPAMSSHQYATKLIEFVLLILNSLGIDTVVITLLIAEKYLQCRPFASYTHGC